MASHNLSYYTEQSILIAISLLFIFDSVSGFAQYPGNQDETLLPNSELFAEEYLIALNAKQIYSIATADLDGDGDNDIVIGSFKTDKVSWFRNDGYNDFGNKQVIGNADNIASVHASDIDGDGDMDVLTASTNDNDILLFENDGNGNFSEEQLIGNIDQAWSVTSADLDGDGDMDIVTGGLSFNMTAWFENLGENIFGPVQVINSSEFINSPLDFFDVHIEDLDGDNDLDVLSCSYDEDKISWYENNGEGEFSEEQIISTAVNGPVDITTGDLDGDGDPDVLCAGRLDGGQLIAFENLGESGFGPKSVVSTQNPSLRNIDAKDLDLDGDVDIVANTSSQSTLSWYENDGTGNFDQHLLSGTPNSYSVHCSDLDNDGLLDLITGRQVGLQWSENLLFSSDCNLFQDAPVDLNKSFPFINGVQDRVRLKFYKQLPQIKYTSTDAAACDIKFWELRNLDPETGLVIGNVIENPDTLLLIDKKKFYPNGSPRSIFKWPVKYFEEGANNENRALPNKRYQWQVRCACEHGDGPESPWSEIKFFDTPDFDMNTGEFEGLISQNDSESKSFGLQSSRHDELTVWPNPTSGEINVSIPSVLAVNMKKGFPLIVELIDGLGRVVPRSTFEISLSAQQQYMIVKLDPLPPGVYLLRSVMGSEVYSNTIIKE